MQDLDDELKKIEAEIEAVTKDTWCGNCRDDETIRYLANQIGPEKAARGLAGELGQEKSVKYLSEMLARFRTGNFRG